MLLDPKTLGGFMDAREVADMLKCSKSKAYTIMRTINHAEKEKGHMYVAGRVSRLLLAEHLGLVR